MRRGYSTIDIYSDASAHRIISDVSTFVGHTNPLSHRLLVAGDFNTIYGATDDSRLENARRARTVFDRIEALGMEFKGPQWPDADRRAEPTPQGLPPGTKNVPTYLTGWERRRMRDEGIFSGNQLDYVFASRGFHKVQVHAMNDVRRIRTKRPLPDTDRCAVAVAVTHAVLRTTLHLAACVPRIGVPHPRAGVGRTSGTGQRAGGGEAWRFLFGRRRETVARLATPLLQLQDGSCFYCGKRIAGKRQVDHFVPWSRHPPMTGSTISS